MRPFRSLHVVLVLAASVSILALGSCAEQVTRPEQSESQTRNQDAASPQTEDHTVDHFSFLPPLGEDVEDEGEFEPRLLDYLRVEVCEWTGTECLVPLVATFTSIAAGKERLRLEESDEQYITNWNASRTQVGSTVQIRVFVGGVELGRTTLDVDVPATVPIKFRITKGLSEQSTIDSQGGVVVNPGTGAALEIAPNTHTGPVTYGLFSEDGVVVVHESLGATGHQFSLDASGETVWNEDGFVRLVLPVEKAPPSDGRTVVQTDFGELLREPTSGGPLWGDGEYNEREQTVSLRFSSISVGEFLALLEVDSFRAMVLPEAFIPEASAPLPQSNKAGATTSGVSLQADELSSIVGCQDYPLALANGSKEPEPGDIAIVLVHGWISSIAECDDFKKAQEEPNAKLPGSVYFKPLIDAVVPLISSDFPTYVFTYPSFRGVDASGAWLAKRIAQLLDSENLAGVVIVGHSMGGLVARYAISEAEQLDPSKVQGLLTLGTPHSGSPFAEIAWLGVLKPGLDTDGGRDLVAPSEYLTSSSSVPITTYGGKLIVEDVGLDFRVTNRTRLPGWYEQTAVQLCGQFEECVSDGVVPAPSALPTLSDTERDFPYTHSELHQGMHEEGGPDPNGLYEKIESDIRRLAKSEDVFIQTDRVVLRKGIQSLTVADFNGDGTIDIAAANTQTDRVAGNTVSILSNDGTGDFSEAATLTVRAQPRSLVAGQLDDNRSVDLLLVSNGEVGGGGAGSGVTALLNDGSGRFPTRSVIDVPGCEFPAGSADLDEDGVLDLAAVPAHCFRDGSLVGIADDGALSRSASFDIGAVHPSHAAFVDIDSDENVELLVVNRNDFGDPDKSFVGVFSHDQLQQALSGKASIQKMRSLDVNARSPQMIMPGDFDGQMGLDFIVSANGSQWGSGGGLHLFTNDGAGTFTETIPVRLDGPIPLSRLPTPDLDDDGVLDVVLPLRADALVHVYLNDGNGHFTRVAELAVEPNPWAVAVADFDKDGDLDLAVGHRDPAAVTVFENRGAF